MRQTHVAGEKLFVDYAGPTVPIIDAANGEISRAHIFVAVWGASNYTYAEATAGEKRADWIAAHVNAFAFFGGVPALLVPDNPRTLIRDPDRYEPLSNRTYEALAEHYGCAILPARPRKPQDKAKVEAGVLLVERWILARLRHWRFHSLADLNAAIRPLLDELNARPFQKLDGSRRRWFELLDRPALRPLPLTPFEYAEFKRARVSRLDYHVECDRHYYSVPHTLVGQEVELRVTRGAVEVLFRHQRVASHARSYRRGRVACCTGRHRSARRPPAWWRICSNRGRIRNRVTAPASACSRWRASTATRDSKPPAHGHSRSARRPVSPSPPSSPRASIASPRRTASTTPFCPRTRMCAAPSTTTDRKETDRCSRTRP